MKRQAEDLDQKQGKKVSTEGYLNKLKTAYEEMNKELEVDVENNKTQMGHEEQKKHIEAKLKECVSIGDLDKALAIIYYAKNFSEIAINELVLEDEENENSIAYVAYQNNIGENYDNFINVCQTLGYIGESSDIS